jgi:hypothetical protein
LFLLPFGNLCGESVSTTTFPVWPFSFLDVVAPSEAAPLLTFKPLLGRARQADSYITKESMLECYPKQLKDLRKQDL